MSLWEDLYRLQSTSFDQENFEVEDPVNEPIRGGLSTMQTSGTTSQSESSEIVGLSAPQRQEESGEDNFQRGASGFGEDDFIQDRQPIEEAATDAQQKTQSSPTEYNNSMASAQGGASQVSSDSVAREVELENGAFASAMANYEDNWNLNGTY